MEDTNAVINFKSGLPGFENLHQFRLKNTLQDPFFLLESIEDENIAFILLDPFLICPEYEIEISDSEMKRLNISGEKESALIFTIISIRNEGTLFTANLQAPIIINPETREGEQFILNEPKWSIRYNIIDRCDETEKEEASC